MDPNKVAKRDGRARSAPNVNERHTLIHPEYEIILDGQQIGPTGLLVIARLRPMNATTRTLPEFVFRWDEKDNHLDVDPVDVSEAEGSKFRKGTGSYYGHRARKLQSGSRIFQANIGWHGYRIYRGEIGFNLAREAEIRAGIRLSVSASMSSTNRDHLRD